MSASTGATLKSLRRFRHTMGHELVPVLRPDSAELIRAFIADQVKNAGALIAVVGLSAGVDSAVVATLAAGALGPKRVVGVLLPLELKGPDVAAVRLIAGRLRIRTEERAIGPLVRPLHAALGGDRKARGNLVARLRMALLYHEAAGRHGVVLGTGNKSELCLQYFTKHGDGGVDFQPIGDLYKTQVWELARSLGIPRRIVEKPPSAGLWPGQTDEADLGIAYRDADRVLFGIELRLGDAEIARRTGVALTKVRSLRARVASGRHKRVPPMIPKLGLRTFGIDWLE